MNFRHLFNRLRFPSPRLVEQVQHDERLRLAQMTLDGSNGFGKFSLRYQAFRHDPVAKVVDELQEDRPATVIRSVNLKNSICYGPLVAIATIQSGNHSLGGPY